MTENDVVFARTGASVGKTYVYTPTDGNIYFAGFLVRAKFKSSILANFVFYTTLTSKYLNYIKVTSQRSGQPGVNAKEYGNFAISITDSTEQFSIILLLKKLDGTINLHERKCEELALIKKALLQKLFPKKDEIKPEVRYKNFSDAWEQRKLGEILKERKERSSIGELISVTINNGVVKADSLERKDNSSSDKSNYKVVCKGDIAYNSMRMWQGASGYSPYNGILSPAYTVLIPTEKVDSKFISYMFKKEKMLQQFQKYSQGLTSDTWNLKYPMLKDIPVLFPKIDEQVSIRKHLDNISSLIALHQRKLEKLKQLKKFLLQNMFI